jgi:subtilisin family serine protease
MVGMAPGTEIVACRVFSNEGASFGDVIAAMVHSADVGCDVANMSLGAYPLPQTPAVLQLKQQFERAAEYARSKGTLMIASAGNSGANLDAEKALSLPNEAEGIMSVAATGPIGYRWDDSGYNSWTSNPIESWGGLEEMDDALYNVSAEPSEPAVYTNYGAESTDISAPGGNYDEAIAGLYSGDNAVFENLWDWYYDLVLSTTVTETEDGYVADYGFKAGTSMAAPNAAGTAALVREAFPDLSAADLAAHLKATAADVGPEKFHGSGYLDTEAAVETTPEASDD